MSAYIYRVLWSREFHLSRLLAPLDASLWLTRACTLVEQAIRTCTFELVASVGNAFLVLLLVTLSRELERLLYVVVRNIT